MEVRYGEKSFTEVQKRPSIGPVVLEITLEFLRKYHIENLNYGKLVVNV